MTSRLSRADLLDAEPIWLLTVHWAGRVFRIATEVVTLSSDDGDQQYRGGLKVGEFSDTLPRSTVASDGGSASVECFFPGVNVATEYWQQRPLDAASCEVAMVLKRKGAVVQAYEGRFVLLVGAPTGVQFGWPEQPTGWAAFTVSSAPYNDASPILDGGWRILGATWTNYDNDPATNIGGAAYPVVFGRPGDSTIPGSPGYLVDTTGSAQKIFLSVGHVEASTVVLWDDRGRRVNAAPVAHTSDGRGVQCAYANIGAVSGASFTKTGGDYWVGWASGGGALSNPYGSGYLEKASDVIRWLFDRTRLRVDAGAWASLAPVTSRFKFAGYFNDPATTAWDVLRDEILGLLPLAVRIGSDGAYPISLVPTLTPGELPLLTVSEESGVWQTSPLQVTTAPREVANALSVDYYLNARAGRLSRSIYTSADTTDADRERIALAELSAATYGARAGEGITAGYVYDDDTVRHILRGRLYQQGFVALSVTVEARAAYGWLHVGDQIRLTIARLTLADHRAMILSKRWSAGRWVFEVGITQTPVDHNF